MQNAVKEEVLDYTSFVSLVKEKIIERMGQGYSIKMYKVIKNNSLELDCLAVLKEGANCSPNIYLNAYYESFIEGTSMAEIIDRLDDRTEKLVSQKASYTSTSHYFFGSCYNLSLSSEKCRGRYR